MVRKCVVIIALILLSGCTKTDDTSVINEDANFSFEQDYNYQADNTFFVPSSTGIYMTIGDYFQYYDYATKKFVFLCNKPDCLHNLETDQIKGQQCYAYCENPDYGGMGINFIAYNDHNLYTVQEGALNGAGQSYQSLMSIHIDGSGWEKVVDFPNQVGMLKFHRGKAYYTDTYNDLYVLNLSTKKQVILNEELNSKLKGKSYATIYDHYLYIFAKSYNDTNYGVLIKYDIDTNEYKIIGENLDLTGALRPINENKFVGTDSKHQGFIYDSETKETKIISLDARNDYVGDNYIFLRGYPKDYPDGDDLSYNVYLLDLEGNLLDTYHTSWASTTTVINDELYLIAYENQAVHNGATVYKLSIVDSKLNRNTFYVYKKPENSIAGSMSY